MSKLKTIIIILVVIIILYAGFTFGNIIYSGTPTKGKLIEKYQDPDKALFIIAVQNDFTGFFDGKSLPYQNAESAISNINALISRAEKQNYRIIYIKQEFSSTYDKMISKLYLGGKAIKGNPGTDIDKRVNMANSNIFPKSIGDAFSNPELNKYLTGEKVDEVYLTGLDAEYCVHATAKGALNRGYKVNIITDAILLHNDKKWDKLIKQYQDEGITLSESKNF